MRVPKSLILHHDKLSTPNGILGDQRIDVVNPIIIGGVVRVKLKITVERIIE